MESKQRMNERLNSSSGFPHMNSEFPSQTINKYLFTKDVTFRA